MNEQQQQAVFDALTQEQRRERERLQRKRQRHSLPLLKRVLVVSGMLALGWVLFGKDFPMWWLPLMVVLLVLAGVLDNYLARRRMARD